MSQGFLKLITVDEALGRLLSALPAGGPGSCSVRLDELLHRISADDVVAPANLPGFRRSSMDGYAVNASDTFGAGESLPAYLEMIGEVPMGCPSPVNVEPGQAARISTGGVLPDGADAVVMVENTELSGSTVEVVKAVAPGENTIERDEDIAEGTVVVRRGQVIGPPLAGVLAGLGFTEASVYATPVVGIISTGDELVPVEREPGPGQVRDVNSAALAACLREARCEPRSFGIVEDSLEKLLVESREALSACDALLISGGSSAGVRDVTCDVMARLGDPGVLAHGICLKPGKPTLAAVCDGKPVFGLPGNPASALAVFAELVVPVLARLCGEVEAPWPAVRTVEAVMDRSVPSAVGRLELVPVELRLERGRFVASPIMGKANLIGTLARAHGNVRIPTGSEGIEQGEAVKVELL